MAKANSNKTENSGTLANTAITGLSWYTKITTWLTLFFGVLMLMGGIYVMTLPDVDVTVIKATVSSVTWNGKNECGVTSSTNKKNGESSLVYHCDVVTKYKENDAEKEYEFYSATGTRYKSGDNIDLYKFNGNQVSQLDPNAWKSIGWITMIFGTILVLGSLFWLWVCSWNKTLCAIQGGATILKQTLD